MLVDMLWGLISVCVLEFSGGRGRRGGFAVYIPNKSYSNVRS